MEPIVRNDRRRWDGFKQAIISVIIGATISFLTVLFQGLVHYLQGLPPEVPGAILGMAKYMSKWYTHNNA